MNSADSDTMPTASVARTGVRNRACRWPNTRSGSTRSRPIANSTRVTLAWPAIALAKQPATYTATKNTDSVSPPMRRIRSRLAESRS